MSRRLFLPAGAPGRAWMATSMDLCDHPTLPALLGFAPAFHSRLLPSRAAVYLGWGRKWSGRRAVAIAASAGAEFRLLEDGFLRSVGRDDPPLSLIFDKRGVHYDAAGPSDLEALIAAPCDADKRARAGRLMAEWCRNRVSKYNAARDCAGALPQPYVLVVDQVAGDLSIGYGLAGPEAFTRMLDAALAENPGKTVVVKLHPDALSRGGRSHFNPATLAAMPRVRVVAENCHPAGLIEGAEAVYTVTSQVGFEALIWGKRVRTFGMPFYAGWGLTEDDLPPPARRGRASLAQLVHAALVAYPRYLHPESGTACEVEDVLAHIGLQRRMRQRFPEIVYATGFSRWKRPVLRRFLQGSEVRFVRSVGEVPKAGTLVRWGSAAVPERPDIRVLRIEDGFIRSSGLGADLIAPLSWVIDDEGLYYDASHPSRLETLLQTTAFDPAMTDRARQLREALIRTGVTKYNLNGPGWQRPDGVARVILVPGQVENDASIRLGAGAVQTNLALLQRVRAANPGAYIVYKPHPDVVAGLRRAATLVGAAPFDEIVTDCDPAIMIAQVDEVHTITSLLGFEALLRGVPVTCYGRPFYAGWGLTADLCPIARRTRRLSLDELVAGALIDYPTYVSRRSVAFTTPETAVRELVAWRATGPSRMSFGRRMLRSMLQLWVASGLRSNA
ncbi:capsular polysaccharide biosynthesis protein [Phaeovulum sp.]|uniref:capsular polysaccharide biosynthesis protein n=1 Tax=Phaeovulum sp. TaxID=2934796 RepID=UPI0039E55D3E